MTGAAGHDDSARDRLHGLIQKLSLWRADAVTRLRDPVAHAGAVAFKHELDAAIAALELCQRFQIGPNSIVTALPDLQTMTFSCAYQVAEDGETDDQTHWVKLEVEGETL